MSSIDPREPSVIPGRRMAAQAFLLAALGPFVMGASSSAAIVMGLRSLADSAVSGVHAPGRATAYGAIVVDACGLWFWGWSVARIAGELSDRGKDPSLLVPLVGGLLFVWAVSALAGLLAGRPPRLLG